jgi:two-component sensor histidine kinase
MNTEENDIYLFVILVNILLLGIVIVMGKLMHALAKNKSTHDMQLRELAFAHERSLMEAKLESQELTLEQIARELHDNVNLSLYVSRMNLSVLKTTTEGETQEKIGASLVCIEEAIEKSIDLSRSLNTEWIRGLGLVNVLEQETEKLGNIGQFAIETNISQNQVVMDAEREVFIFRIVQEAFNNIVKHSGAKKIIVSLQYQQDHLYLSITDDGKGFDRPGSGSKARGTGLNNIQLRAKALEARLTIDAAPGKGTTLGLSVPYHSSLKTPVVPLIKEQAAPSTTPFNFIERMMVRNAYTPKMILTAVGFVVCSILLSQHQLFYGLAVLSITIIVGTALAWKQDPYKLSFSWYGKLMLVMARPINFILRMTGIVVLYYGIWIDSFITIISGSFLMFAGGYLNLKKSMKQETHPQE